MRYLGREALAFEVGGDELGDLPIVLDHEDEGIRGGAVLFHDHSIGRGASGLHSAAMNGR
jgi:hypothetical protein